MKVIEQTPTTLKLRTTLWETPTELQGYVGLIAIGIGLCVAGGVAGAVLAGWLGALVFGAIGGVIAFMGMWYVPYAEVFVFDRTGDRLLIQKRYLVRSSETRYPLNTIQAVKTEWLEDSDSDRYLVISLVKPVGRPIYIQDIVQSKNEAEYASIQDIVQSKNEAEYASIAVLIRQFLGVGE